MGANHTTSNPNAPCAPSHPPIQFSNLTIVLVPSAPLDMIRMDSRTGKVYVGPHVYDDVRQHQADMNALASASQDACEQAPYGKHPPLPDSPDPNQIPWDAMTDDEKVAHCIARLEGTDDLMTKLRATQQAQEAHAAAQARLAAVAAATKAQQAAQLRSYAPDVAQYTYSPERLRTMLDADNPLLTMLKGP